MYQRLAKNILLPILDLCQRSNVAYCWKVLENAQYLKRDEIVDLQQRKMRTLLKHAYENVPYYRTAFLKQGVNPDDIRTVEDLRKLPVLKKTVLRNTPQQLMAGNIPRRQLVLCRTSGTTAVPLSFYRTREDVDWGTAAWLRAYRWGKCELGDKHAVIWAFDARELRNPLRRVINLLHREHLLLNAYEMSEATIRLSARRIQELRPKFLMGYSYSIHLLANYLLEAGIRTPELKAVFACTQTLLPSQRREIEMAFGCGVYDLYASREFSLMASECEKHVGYHIQSENVVLEFLKDGEPVSSGETGTILVTSLNNYAMPFIRYEIGDTGKPSDDGCSCGRGLPLFKSLEGRTTRGFEYFATGDGSLLFLRDMEKIFGRLPVKTFQIVQEKRDEILVKVVKANGYSEKDTNFIKRNLVWGHSQQITNVEVEFVKSIPLEKSGKKRYFNSRLTE